MDVKLKGVKMFPSDLEKSYAHEIERRKDEMRAASKHNFESQFIKRRKLIAIPMTILGLLSLILVVLIGH